MFCHFIWTAFNVENTEDIRYPEPERNAVNPNVKTTRLARKSSVPPTQDQPQHPKSSSLEAHDASGLQNATLAVSGRHASLQIIHKRNPGPSDQPLENTGANSKPSRAPEGDVSERPTEYRAKFVAPHSSSEGEVTRLELERQLSVLLSAQTERDQRFTRLTDELAQKSALLEQAEANLADRLLKQTSLAEQRDAELVDMQAKFNELLLSRDQQVRQYEKEHGNVRAKLEANESELKAVRLRLTDAERGWTSLDELVVSRDQQVGQYEKELGKVRNKLEAKESELDAVRLRLADAEKGWTSLDVLVASRDQQVEQHEKELTNVRAQLAAMESELEAVRLRLADAEKGSTKSKLHTVTAGSLVDLNEDRDMSELEGDKQVVEEKRIEVMECNEGWSGC